MSKTLAAKTRVSTFTKSALSLILASVVARAVSAHADVTLWYNGDYWGSGGGIANEIASNLGAHQVYDNFIVSGSTWNVDRIWCNNAMRLTGVTQASWEIRSGMAPGNGGTLVASGLSTATQTATGRAVGTMLEYTISVSGLNVQLAPGTYWLDVSPLVVTTQSRGEHCSHTHRSPLEQTLSAHRLETMLTASGRARGRGIRSRASVTIYPWGLPAP